MTAGGHRERRVFGVVLRRSCHCGDQPEVSSVRDSDRILGILQSKSKKAEEGGSVGEHLLLTRYNPERVEKGEMLALEDVHEILAIDVLGVIPESPDVLSASNSGEPVILASDSDAGQAYVDAVDRLLGQERPSDS